jgi:hypothetical protein
MNNIPDNDMLKVVECPECHNQEYYGMIHWYNGHKYCRHCMYDIWQKRSGWNPGNNDFEFPKYEDGIDYTEKR